MRIGFDGKRIFHNWRGLGNYSRDLVLGLSEFYPDNEYLLFSPPFEDKRALAFENEFGAKKVVTPQGFWGKSFPSMWRRNLSSDLSTHQIDLYHGLSHEIPYGLKKAGIKSIVTIHDLIFMRYPHYFPWIDRRVYLSKVKHAVKEADVVIAICEQTKRDLVEMLNVSPDKIEVCYQSCHEQFQMPCIPDEVINTRSKYGIDRDYILYVGAFEERKNILNLIEGYSYFGTSLDLVLVGKGKNYLQLVESKIKECNVDNNVKILSDVPMSDLKGLYTGAEVFCFPSFFEGFGIPIIEAMFSGTPVITSQGSCFPEVGGDGAIYIDPNSSYQIGKALFHIMNNPDLKQSLIEEGKKHVQQFSRESTARRLYEVYKQVLEE